MKKEKLGEYIKKKRKNIISSRQLALKCGVSPAYMVDIEKDKRVPRLEILNKVSEILKLTDKERHYLLDLAAYGVSNRVSYDIAEYIMENSGLRECIREAMKKGKDDVWEKTLDYIKGGETI